MKKSVFTVYYDITKGTPERLEEKIEELKREIKKDYPLAKITAIIPLPGNFYSSTSYIVNFEER